MGNRGLHRLQPYLYIGVQNAHVYLVAAHLVVIDI